MGQNGVVTDLDRERQKRRRIAATAADEGLACLQEAAHNLRLIGDGRAEEYATLAVLARELRSALPGGRPAA